MYIKGQSKPFMSLTQNYVGFQVVWDICFYLPSNEGGLWCHLRCRAICILVPRADLENP